MESGRAGAHSTAPAGCVASCLVVLRRAPAARRPPRDPEPGGLRRATGRSCRIHAGEHDVAAGYSAVRGLDRRARPPATASRNAKFAGRAARRPQAAPHVRAPVARRAAAAATPPAQQHRRTARPTTSGATPLSAGARSRQLGWAAIAAPAARASSSGRRPRPAAVGVRRGADEHDRGGGERDPDVARAPRATRPPARPAATGSAPESRAVTGERMLIGPLGERRVQQREGQGRGEARGGAQPIAPAEKSPPATGSRSHLDGEARRRRQRDHAQHVRAAGGQPAAAKSAQP